MQSEPLELLSLSDLRPSHDGRRIAFTINCKGDENAAISCAISELPEIISFLVRGAAIANEQSGSEPPEPKAGDLVMAGPLPALGIGFAGTASPAETMLLVHLLGFDLHFVIPSSGLTRLAPELARIATTLAAGTTRN